MGGIPRENPNILRGNHELHFRESSIWRGGGRRNVSRSGPVAPAGGRAREAHDGILPASKRGPVAPGARREASSQAPRIQGTLLQLGTCRCYARSGPSRAGPGDAAPASTPPWSWTGPSTYAHLRQEGTVHVTREDRCLSEIVGPQGQ